jgi:hypothetical protein
MSPRTAMSKFPGVAGRIRRRMVALGYEDASGWLDVPRFTRDFHYDARYVYPWLSGRMTPLGDYLARLAVDLQTTRCWLLLGEGPEASEKPLPWLDPFGA